MMKLAHQILHAGRQPVFIILYVLTVFSNVHVRIAGLGQGSVSLVVTSTLTLIPQPAEERALRVSLLARLPEVAVRAVAKEAGLPNWAWLDPRQGSASR